jgi:hypothetical protein
MAAARQLFERLVTWETHGYDWPEEIKAKGAALAKFADDPVRFRSAVLTIIANVRAALRLPPDPQPFRTRDSIAAK